MTFVRVPFVLFVAALLAVPLASLAAEFRGGEQPSAAREEVINDDLYMAGSSVSSAAAVQGDVFAAGSTVLVDGPVSGDVAAAGSTVMVSGSVADDVRAAGSTVIVRGVVAGDALIAGSQVTLASERVGGDALLAGGTIRIDAPVAGDVRLAGGDVYLNAPIGGNADIRAQKLTLGPRADIAGSLSYSAQKEAQMEAGAVVRGETHFTMRTDSKDIEQGMKAALIAFFTLWTLAKFLMLFVGALVLAFFFKRYARELITVVTEQPLRELGRGAIAMIVLPVASVILLFTVIGIPFGVLGLLAAIGLYVIAALFSPIILGAIIHKRIWKPAEYAVNWKTILLGVAVYFVLGFIPLVGWLAKLGVFLLAAGAIVGIKSRIVKEWR